MTEARRRNEEDWQDSLDTESVQSLSRSFYESFAKGNFSGSVAGKVKEKRWVGADLARVPVLVLIFCCSSCCCSCCCYCC